MSNYTDVDRRNDFDYFIKNYQNFYEKYGHKFLAIQHKQILGVFDSIPEALNTLSQKYKIGSYIIQECSGDDSAYRTTIMRLIIKG